MGWGVRRGEGGGWGQDGVVGRVLGMGQGGREGVMGRDGDERGMGGVEEGRVGREKRGGMVVWRGECRKKKGWG